MSESVEDASEVQRLTEIIRRQQRALAHLEVRARMWFGIAGLLGVMLFLHVFICMRG